MSALAAKLIAWLDEIAGTDISADFWDDVLDDELQAVHGPDGTETVPAATGELLWIVAGELRTRRQHIEGLEAAVSRTRAKDVLANGAVTYGETYITVAPVKTKTIIDKAGLIAWATQHDPEAVEKLWRLDAKNLRITTLRGMAERAWRRDTGNTEGDTLTETEEAGLADYIRATEETFVETTKGDDKLSETPITKAPAWVQKVLVDQGGAAHGHRIGSFKNRAKPQ